MKIRCPIPATGMRSQIRTAIGTRFTGGEVGRHYREDELLNLRVDLPIGTIPIL